MARTVGDLDQIVFTIRKVEHVHDRLGANYKLVVVTVWAIKVVRLQKRFAVSLRIDQRLICFEYFNRVQKQLVGFVQIDGIYQIEIVL